MCVVTPFGASSCVHTQLSDLCWRRRLPWGRGTTRQHTHSKRDKSGEGDKDKAPDHMQINARFVGTRHLRIHTPISDKQKSQKEVKKAPDHEIHTHRSCMYTPRRLFTGLFSPHCNPKQPSTNLGHERLPHVASTLSSRIKAGVPYVLVEVVARNPHVVQ